MADEFKVVCGVCKTDPEIIADAHGEVIVCPTCGQRDSLKEASRIAGEHFVHQAAAGMQKDLGRLIKGKGAMEFKPKRLPSRSFKWHAVPL